MSRAKRFFLIFGIVYIAGAATIHVFFGSTDLSPEEYAEYERAYERYLDITKDPAYDKWEQSPEANPPDEALREKIAYVEQLEALPIFQSEQRRQAIFESLFDLFNATMGAVIIGYFGWPPLRNFLDQGIKDLRMRIESLRVEREAAESRRKAAEQQMAALEQEKARIQEDAEAIAEEERRKIAETAHAALEQVNAETARRKQLEEQMAAMRLKDELITLSLERVVAQFTRDATAEDHAALVDSFIGDVEALR